jgi:hypothetical protein
MALDPKKLKALADGIGRVGSRLGALETKARADSVAPTQRGVADANLEALKMKVKAARQKAYEISQRRPKVSDAEKAAVDRDLEKAIDALAAAQGGRKDAQASVTSGKAGGYAPIEPHQAEFAKADAVGEPVTRDGVVIGWTKNGTDFQTKEPCVFAYCAEYGRPSGAYSYNLKTKQEAERWLEQQYAARAGARAKALAAAARMKK